MKKKDIKKHLLKLKDKAIVNTHDFISKHLPSESPEEKFAKKLNDFCAYQKEVRSNLVHDIRNPLLNIKLSLEVHKSLIKKLKAKYHDFPDDVTENFEKHYKMINRDIRQIDFYIDQTLELEKNPLEELNLNLKKHNLKRNLQTLFHKFQNIYADDDRTFNLEFNLKDEMLFIDKEKVNRMILNLLSNAIKYTPKGAIFLKAFEDDTHIFISVEDTGYGIPEDKVNEILQRFKQAESPYQQTGSGIGLNIVNHLIKLHGGEIEIQSKENHGSTFKLKMPKKII